MDEASVSINDDITQLCRLCLIGGVYVIDVFSDVANGTGRIPLYLRISHFFEVQINENDDLPTKICMQCLQKTEICTEFRAKCIKNDKKLRNMVSCKDKIASSCQTVDENLMTIVVDPMKDYESSDHSNQSEDENLPDGNNSDGGKGIEDDHSKEETDKKIVYMCKYCDVAFALSEACFVHELKDHDIQCPHACHLCDHKTIDRNLLINHIRETHALDRPYICIQCHKGFHRRCDLKKHTFVHTGVRPYTCQVCGKTFTRNTNLTKHLRIHTGFKPHSCDDCPKSFANKADLVRHQTIHFDVGKQFSCSKCNQAYTRKYKLLTHERICMVKIKEAAVPSVSQQPLNEVDEENMVISLDPFDEETQVEVEEGTQNTSGQSGFSVPDHIQNLDILFPDHVTGDDIINGNDLGINNTEPLRNFACDRCPKKFTTKTTLQTHHFSHLDIRNYVCQVCNKAFIRKRELDRHSAIHTGHKPFECKVCQKTFSRKDKLLRHERIHDDKLFPCTNCDAKFTRKESLALHSKVHCTTTMDSSEVIFRSEHQQHGDEHRELQYSAGGEKVPF